MSKQTGLYPDKIYSSLNTQQKKAVDTTEGPVLVLAGPGTGKTQLLAARVASIIEKTGADARDILCLTYTDSAASNMRDRISAFIGNDAQRVAVHTFHSLGSEIINQFPEYFYSGADMQPADEVVQSEIIEQILQKLPHDNPLTKALGSEYSQIVPVRNALDATKKAGLNPAELRPILEITERQIAELEPTIVSWFNDIKQLSMKYLDELSEKLAGLPAQEQVKFTVPFKPFRDTAVESLGLAIKQALIEGKTKRVGAWRDKWLRRGADGKWAKLKERERVEWWKAFNDAYEEYEEQMIRARRFDFADMISKVVHTIESEPDLRAEIQEKWLYIMVDEFQDTNAAQLRLVRLIADSPVHEGKPNIMVVGDDDQGIFKFQGAELDNISAFINTYSVNTITLTENYRSHNEILNYSRELITQAEDRLEIRMEGLNKALEQSNKKIKSANINRYSFDTQLDENAWIAKQISKSISSGVSANEIAIISRKHDRLKSLVPFLQKENISIHYDRQAHIFELPVIRQMILMVRLVDSLSRGQRVVADGLIGEILSHPMWQLDHEDLWKWSSQSDKKLIDHALELEEEDPIHKIVLWFLKLSHSIHNKTLEAVIDILIGNSSAEEEGDEVFFSPYRNYYFNEDDFDSKKSDYLQALSALRLLRNRLREYAGNERIYVPNMIHYLDVLDRTGSHIVDETPFVQDESAVQLMSAHKAKGMEFEHVYIISCEEDVWAKALNNKTNYLQSLPIGPAGDGIDDFIRLLFVAQTRAKTDLNLTTHLYTDSGKDTQPLLMLGGTSAFTKIDSKDTDVIDLLETSWLDYHPNPGKNDKSLIQPLLDNYRLSVTHLINFLNVTDGGPKNWFIRNLLQFPSAKGSLMSYGTAMHVALENGLKQYKSREELTLKELQGYYEIALNKEQLNDDEHKRFLGQGLAHLEMYYKQRYPEWNEDDLPEISFADQGVVIGDARLGGKIDRIHVIDKKTVQVVDIKTGKSMKSWGNKAGDVGLKTWKYRLQLVFYKILVENSREYAHKYKVSQGALEFTQPDDFDQLKVLTLDITDEEVENTKELIKKVWSRMQNLDLPDTSSYGDDYKAIQKFVADLLDK